MNVSNLSKEGGNTKTPSVPRKTWCFTYFFNHGAKEQEILNFQSIFLEKKMKYIFGIEKCPSTGNMHFQGYCQHQDKINFRPFDLGLPKDVHWEGARGNRRQNEEYCSKDGKVYTNMKIKRPISDPLYGRTYRPMQKEVMDILKTEPDDRTIHWFCDDGGEGKTAIARHIIINNKDRAIYVNGKATDIKSAVADFVNDKSNDDLEIIILGFPRSCEDYVSYDALESLKDGLFFSGKYESKMIVLNPPHIIVFANFPPATEKLTADRWNIRNRCKESCSSDD